MEDVLDEVKVRWSGEAEETEGGRWRGSEVGRQKQNQEREESTVDWVRWPGKDTQAYADTVQTYKHSRRMLLPLHHSTTPPHSDATAQPIPTNSTTSSVTWTIRCILAQPSPSCGLDLRRAESLLSVQNFISAGHHVWGREDPGTPPRGRAQALECCNAIGPPHARDGGR